MLKIIKKLITIYILLLLTACAPTYTVNTLNEQALTELSSEQIVNLNLQSCLYHDSNQIAVKQSHPLNQYLYRLIQPFPNTINGKELNYRVYLNTQPNAWSSLNGCIRINSGLLKILNDHEIQAVIAHEIGHIALNHSITAFHHAKAAEIKNNNEIILFVPQSLSQKQEIAADNYAINLLKQLNIDPNVLITMLDKLNNYQKEQSYSHPTIMIRKNNLINKIN
ncbi:M48 family metalloprotease [Orbus wheelerorum]|uniref:M48 family metalloprotease n=1 Tax=Orbus wheelerorum TaxID=3074111 RepID=UPI00370D38E9